MNKIKLGDVLEVKRGMSLPGEYYATEGDYIRLTLGNFNYPSCGWKKNVLKDNLFFTGNVRDEYILKKGDIITPLTEQVRGLLGNTATIPEDALYIQSGDIGLIIPDETKLDKRFSYYLVSSSVVKKQLDARSQQTKIRHTSPEAIKDCVAFIPIIKEQKKISYLLDCINKKIENNNAINDNLLDSVQAIFRSWFVDYDPFDGVCPSNWETGCVEDIAEFFDSMRKPLSSLERTDMERIYPYYGAVSIVDYVDDYIFDGEYLLVSEDGIYVVDENGHPLIQHISGKFWANNHAHILKGKSGFNEDSLYLFLANTNMAPIVTGAAQPKINQANLKSFPITIPDSETMLKFNNIIQPFFDQRLTNESEIKKLEALQSLLLTRLVD